MYPVVDGGRNLVGTVTSDDLRELLNDGGAAGRTLKDLSQSEPIVAYTDEPLRAVVYRMAESGLTRFPVLERSTNQLAGMISLDDLLRARSRNLEEEIRRERVFRIRLPFGDRGA
jgi:chloride channel protein, CIC family